MEQDHEDQVMLCVRNPAGEPWPQEKLDEVAAIPCVLSVTREDADCINVCIATCAVDAACPGIKAVARLFPDVPISWNKCAAASS